MGPWSHGDWARNSANATIGNINFGDSISGFYQKNIEANFFRHFEKITQGENNYQKPTCLTGCKRVTYDAWPEENTEKQDFIHKEINYLVRDNEILHLKSLLVILRNQFPLQKISTKNYTPENT
jgi:acyl-CoA-binding protein